LALEGFSVRDWDTLSTLTLQGVMIDWTDGQSEIALAFCPGK